MSASDMAAARARPARRVLDWLWSLRPPIESPRFWAVQAGVLGLALLHDVVLDGLRSHPLYGVPAPTSSGLMLIPVIYAALNFGMRGAFATSLWATWLLVPNWFLAPQGTAAHFWIEAGYLFILNVVAIVVGQRVENEQRARRSAEAALQAAKDARARYYSLFEDQPAPVVVTDATGAVCEANTAATRRFGSDILGRPLETVLGVGAAELLDGTSRCLELSGADGEQVSLVPTAHRISTAQGSDLVQVLLTDVTEQHHREEEERLFAGRLLTVQEEERRRLAREIHDDSLQDLTYLTRTLDDLSQRPEIPEQYVDQLVAAAAVATDATSALRKLIHGLRPPVLDDLGLVSALRQLVHDAGRRTGLAVKLRIRGEEARLPRDLELAAYRIAQEALNNVIRHAGATRVYIGVAFGDALVLTVSDNGRGMAAASEDSQDSEKQPSGLGLIGMRERIGMAGGSLTITPRSPHGTRVRASLPMPSAQPAPSDARPLGSPSSSPRRVG